MPLKNREVRIAYNRQHYTENADAIKKKEREKYKLHHDTIRARRQFLDSQRKEERATTARKEYADKRALIIQHYGGKCICCGEDEPLFLEIDHINNDGWTHRKEIGTSAKALLLWIIRNDFPDSIQILCANCNQGKKRNGGVCPHQLKIDR